MRYTLLGPVEVTTPAGPVALERPQRRALLALLLLHANQFVGTDQIIQALWGGAPPATARAQLHALVAAIRKALDEGGVTGALVTRPGGYTLKVDDGDCDVQVFEDLLRRAQAGTVPGESIRLLREALGLWRGAPLEGIVGGYVEAARARLQEQRLGAHEKLADLELAAGRHAELVAPLTALVAANPLRERLVGQLMLALYRSGRQAEALQTARDLRRTLADEEGLDPGAEVLRLETAILRADPALDAPARPAAPVGFDAKPVLAAPETPRQLPPAPSAPTGRTAETAELEAAIAAGSTAVVLHGPGGTGKSALAVEWAHSVADRYPDGQLFIDLRGSDPGTALTAAEAVDEALRGFGVPPDQLGLPDGQAQAMYRALVASRCMLIVLDDAAADAPVRAMLADDGPAVFLVTARAPIAGAHPVAVEARPTVDAPSWANLDPVAGRLLRLLAGVPVREITAGAAAALIDRPVADAEHLLADLTARRLLHGTPDGRHRLPATVRDKAAALPGAVDHAAFARLGAYYLHAAEAAAKLLHPHGLRLATSAVPPPTARVTFTDHRPALTWLEAERHNLTGLIQQAARTGHRPLAWLLADALRGYYSLTMRTTAWATAANTALTAATADRDEEAESAAHLSLAELHLRRSRRPGAWQQAWAVLADTPTPPPAAPATTRHTVARPIRPTRRRALLVGLVLVLVAGIPAGSGRLAPSARAGTDGTLVEETERGPATVVLRSSVAGLRIDEAVDFDDGGRLNHDDAPGIDLTPYASGNHLSGKNNALMALLPRNAPPRYRSCADIPETARQTTLFGTYAMPDGQRICLWTRPGRIVLMTLTHAPRQQRPDVAFDYVVWQGTAPTTVASLPPRPPDTQEDAFRLGGMVDGDGVNVDSGGAKVAFPSPHADASMNRGGRDFKVENGAILAPLPDQAPGEYASCANIPPEKYKVGVELLSKKEGFRFCLYAYSGRVAMVTLSRRPTADIPSLDLDFVVWRGTAGTGPVSETPAPWNRGPYTQEQKTRVARGEKP